MIRFNEESPVQLESRLGRVGSIRSFGLWQLRESREAMIEGVAQIASISYGNEEAKNPQKLFDRIVELGHLSCLEFVPCPIEFDVPICSLPISSLRTISKIEGVPNYSKSESDFGKEHYAATGFLVECPIFVARQWMRHRSFSYLEMSRRYVKGAKVPLKFYGWSPIGERTADVLYDSAEEAYDKLIKEGEPAELARRVLPVGLMTKFYCGGFNRDWEKFVALRSDAHAQPEIRVFADYIKGVI